MAIGNVQKGEWMGPVWSIVNIHTL